MEISYHVSWRRDTTAGGYCDSNKVRAGSYIPGEGSLTCQHGCYGVITPMTYICTDYSTEENWSIGERHFTDSFGPFAGDTITIGFVGCCWVAPFNSSWNILTTFSLTKRSDTGQINSSPRAMTSPVLHLQEGCNHTIPLAVSDPDGDIIKCRWAVGEECGGICDAFPGAELNKELCIINYKANMGTGYKAVAVMIEDFSSSSQRAFSSVAIQFLILVVPSTRFCSQQPQFIKPTTQLESCILLTPGVTFKTHLVVSSGGTSVSIVEIQTVSPHGTKKGTLSSIPGTNHYFVNITWTPETSQLNQTHPFCFTAVNSVGLSSEQLCIQIMAGYHPPVPNPKTASPNQKLVHPFETTWHIQFDKEVQRPTKTAFIIFYEVKSEREVYRIDASLSSEVTLNHSEILLIAPHYRFSQMQSFYINFERGVVQGLQGCGPLNEPINNKTFWTFETLDVTPPHIRFLVQPRVSNTNISLSWESNENVTWECSLVVNFVTSSVNCSGANWRGYNLSEGRYELMITATDDTGNVATLAHTFEVDLTPPTVNIVRKPKPLSNIVRPVITFTCNEAYSCSFECQLYNRSKENMVSASCRNGQLVTPTLKNNVSYMLSVIATDYVGNRGQPINYQWETDFVKPQIFGINDTTALCSDTIPDYTGRPQVTDDRSVISSLTYYDSNHGCSIKRTWTAIDGAGNSAHLEQQIGLEFSPSLSLLTTLSFPCDSASNLTKVPINTASAPNPCNLPLKVSFKDSISERRCPSDFVRNWTVSVCNKTVLQSQLITLYDVCPLHACGRNEITPRGVCSFGECQCNRPWFGDNCDAVIYEPVAEPVDNSILQEAEQYFVNLHVSQGTPPLSWTLVSGPRHLSVDQYNGQVIWFFAVVGDHTVIVQVENQVGQAEFVWKLQVLPGYSTMLHSVSPTTFPRPQPIVLSGAIKYTKGNLVEEFRAGTVPVSVDIISNGATRTLNAFTNKEGKFSVAFYPSAMEYGNYKAGSRHPGLSSTVDHTQWSILGFKSTPNRVYLIGEAVSSFEKVFYNSTILCNDGPARLSNIKLSSSLSNSELVNVSILFGGMQSNNITLEPGEKASINILLFASNPISGVFAIIIQSSQGPSMQITVNFNIEPILPHLLIEPSSINTRIIRGTSRILEFIVTNTGRTVANDVHSLLPKNDFVSFVSFGNPQTNESNLNLRSGEMSVLSLLVQTPVVQALGDISATVAIISTQVSVSVPIRLTVSSNLLMNLIVIVEDEFTYFASGEPLVNNAAITLINYQRGIRITLTTEAGNGTVTFINIHEDRYEMFIEAPDHLSLRQVIITSVDDPVLTLFMQRQTVTYTWSVTPVEFEDIYEITVEADFVTNVPIPIVTVNPAEIDLELFELGFYSAFQINITNHGLIRANSTNLQLPNNHPFLVFTADTTELGYIEPLSSVIITINVTHKDNKRQARFCGFVPKYKFEEVDDVLGPALDVAAVAAIAVAALRNQVTATFEAIKWLMYGLNVIYSYICGTLQSRTIVLVFKKLQCIERSSRQAIAVLQPGPIIYQPPNQVRCTNCHWSRRVESDVDFLSYSADTLAFCNSCISVILGCWPSPKFPLAGCIPLAVSGPANEKSIKALILAQIKWLQCILGSLKNPYGKIAAEWIQAGFCTYDTLKCLRESLKVINSRKRKNVDTMLLDLFESMFPIVQSLELATEVLGNQVWISAGNATWVSDTLQPTLDDSSDAGALISTTELSAILTESPPNGTTREIVQRLVERLNNTLHGWNNGQLEPVEGFNMASFNMVEKLSKDINTYNDIAVDKGFLSYLDAYNFASGEMNKLNSWNDAAGVCAVVRIRIEQELAVTRTAFLAKLEIENKESSPLLNGHLDILIKDAGTGVVATHLFAIGNGSLSGSLTDGDEGWTLPSEASGSIEWLIIPFSEAAPKSDRSYDVGGTLKYSLDGENITIPLVPTVITVTPDPSLLVHYFWERFVVGDDPFTDEVEDSVPFTLGVAVKNAGHGVASSLRITSGQPEIIENKKGLLISFMIIGAMIGNGSIEPSLTVMFGDVPPDTTKVARWKIISSLQGEFRNYSATFENINPLGDPNLSILDELEIHELIRNVRIYNPPEDDRVLDFLVNELDDLLTFPDALYSSKTLERYNVSVGTILSVHSITTTLLEVRTFTNTTGWVYYRYEDTQGILQSTALTVNGSKQDNNRTISLPPENSWITRNKSAETFSFHVVDNITIHGEVTFMMDLCSSDCHGVEMKFTTALTGMIVPLYVACNLHVRVKTA